MLGRVLPHGSRWSRLAAARGPLHPGEMARAGYLDGRRIVIAEDVETLRFCLGERLEEDGAEVVAVSDGRRLFELLATVEVDAVVSDLRMPGIGGLDVLRLRRDGGDTTPFVLATGAAPVLDLSVYAP